MTEEDQNDQDLLFGEVMQPRENPEDILSAGLADPAGPPLPGKLSYEELLGTYRQLKPAQEKEAQQNSNLGLLSAGNQIAQAMAAGYGAKIDDGSKAIEALKEQAAQPVKSLEKKIEVGKAAMDTAKVAALNEENEKMADPKSDISKMYREQAYSLLGKIDETGKYDGQLENMSATQLLKLPGLKNAMAKAGQGSAGTAIGFGQFVNAKGQPLAMSRDNKLINVETGQLHRPGDGVVRPIGYTDPVTGYRGYQGPGTFTPFGTGAGGQAAPVKGTYNESGDYIPAPKDAKAPKKNVGDLIRERKITPDEVKIIDKDKEGFETAMKPQLTVAASLESVPTLAKQALTNPNAAASLGGIIGGMFEPGKLTDEDALRYVRQSGLENQFKNYISEKATGTLRKETVRDIVRTANGLKTELENIARRKAVQMAASNNNRLLSKEVDPETVADYYYTKPVSKAKASASGKMVKVKSPSGAVKEVPEEQAAILLKRPGYTQGN